MSQQYTLFYNDKEFKFETDYCAVPLFYHIKYCELNTHDKKIVDQILRFHNRTATPDDIISLHETYSTIPYISLEP
jgi:hypothetical protein